MSDCSLPRRTPEDPGGPRGEPESNTEYTTNPDCDRKSSRDDYEDVDPSMDKVSSMPNLNVMDSSAVFDVALPNVEESLEGVVGSSVVFSLPGGVDSLCRDTACPAGPEEHQIIPETLEGPPPPENSLAMFPGASAVPFPEEQRIAVSGFSGLTPAVFGLMARMNGLEELAMHQQHMLNRGSYDRGVMRRSLGMLAEFAGVDMEKPGCGCQHPGKC